MPRQNGSDDARLTALAERHRAVHGVVDELVLSPSVPAHKLWAAKREKLRVKDELAGTANRLGVPIPTVSRQRLAPRNG